MHPSRGNYLTNKSVYAISEIQNNPWGCGKRIINVNGGKYRELEIPDKCQKLLSYSASKSLKSMGIFRKHFLIQNEER